MTSCCSAWCTTRVLVYWKKQWDTPQRGPEEKRKAFREYFVLSVLPPFSSQLQKLSRPQRPSSPHFGTILGILIEFPDEGRLIAPPAFVNTGLVFHQSPFNFCVVQKHVLYHPIQSVFIISGTLSNLGKDSRCRLMCPYLSAESKLNATTQRGLVLEKRWHLCDLGVHCLRERPRTGSRRLNAPDFTPVPLVFVHRPC